jgi:hypothetical protein
MGGRVVLVEGKVFKKGTSIRFKIDKQGGFICAIGLGLRSFFA